MEIKVYDKADNLLAEFVKWNYAEPYILLLQDEMDVYVDTPTGFYEFPKKED